MATLPGEPPCSESGSHIVDEARTRVACRAAPDRLLCRVSYAHVALGGTNFGWLQPYAGASAAEPAELSLVPLAPPAAPVSTEVFEARADLGWRIVPAYVVPHVGAQALRLQPEREIHRLQGAREAGAVSTRYRQALKFLADAAP